MRASGSDGEFRVTDRRRRAEADEPAPAPPRADVPSHAVDEPEPLPTQPEVRTHEAPRPDGAEERGLEGLFVMLASSAAVALGEAADPMTGEVRRDPAAAADAIDLLVLLREKTEGNRSLRETQLLDELIYDLQIRYVATVKRRL